MARSVFSLFWDSSRTVCLLSATVLSLHVTFHVTKEMHEFEERPTKLCFILLQMSIKPALLLWFKFNSTIFSVQEVQHASYNGNMKEDNVLFTLSEWKK
jgi:hypothetical protein